MVYDVEMRQYLEMLYALCIMHMHVCPLEIIQWIKMQSWLLLAICLRNIDYNLIRMKSTEDYILNEVGWKNENEEQRPQR